MEEKRFVNHKDGDKQNNIVSNLEWCTRSENSKHSFALGLQSNRGEKHPGHKLTDNLVHEIRELRLATGLPYYRIAELYNISKTNTMDICKRKVWSHL